METKILENLGLTRGEIKVYFALIKLGASTSGPITDKSGVSRSKIYNILEKLMQKGIVSYVIKEKTKYYQAEDPIKIRDYADKKEKEFQEQKKQIDKLIPQLLLQQNKENDKNNIQIYKGFKGIQTITDKVYSRLKQGETFYDIGIPSHQEEKYHRYWQEEDHPKRIKLGIKVKMLFNPEAPRKTLKNRNQFWGCEARYMPINVETPSWFLIYKDVVVIILQEEEPIAIEITNKHIAHSFKQYFEAFWKQSRK